MERTFAEAGAVRYSMSGSGTTVTCPPSPTSDRKKSQSSNPLRMSSSYPPHARQASRRTTAVAGQALRCRKSTADPPPGRTTASITPCARSHDDAATCAGVALQDRDRPLEERRREAVVAVQHGHEVGPGSGDPRVPGRADPTVGLTQHPDTSVPLEPLDDLDRLVVGRAVVDHDDGIRDAGLAQDRLDRLGDQPALVERGDDHAHAQHALMLARADRRRARTGHRAGSGSGCPESSRRRSRARSRLGSRARTSSRPAAAASTSPRRAATCASRSIAVVVCAACRSSWKSSRVGSEVAK